MFSSLFKLVYENVTNVQNYILIFMQLQSFIQGEGVLCLNWNSIEIKPRPNIQSPKKYEHSDVTFSNAHLWIQNDLTN